MVRLDSYRIGIPRELSEIRTQPWLSEGSLTCDLRKHIHVNKLRCIFIFVPMKGTNVAY